MNKKKVKVKGEEFSLNNQRFNLVTNPNATCEHFGYDPELVEDWLYIADHESDGEWMRDSDFLNDIGIIYENGICTQRDMHKAIHFYERAVALDNDLARSNLADIYRKGTHGVTVDKEKAFRLYQACRLPYAYYRMGEAYEHGWGVTQNIDEAQKYYRVAYKGNHPLARKKLQEWNFLEDK